MNSLTAPERAAASRNGAQPLDEIWAELDTRIRWSERAPAIVLFFSDAAASVKRLREMTTQALSYNTMKLRLLQFDDASELPQALVQALFSAPDGTDLAVSAIQTWPLWIELYNGLGPEWDKARHDCLRTLNSSRNQMLEHTSKLIAIVLPLSWHRRVQEIAPDLFSVRSMMVDLPHEALDQFDVSDSTSVWQNDFFPKYDAEAIAPSEEERILQAEYERLKLLGKLPGFELAQRLGGRIAERGDFHAARAFFSEVLNRGDVGLNEDLYYLALSSCADLSLEMNDLQAARTYIEQLLRLHEIIGNGNSDDDQLAIKNNSAGTLLLAAQIYQRIGDSAQAAEMLKESDRVFQSIPPNQQTSRIQIISLLLAGVNSTFSNEQRLRFTEKSVLLARESVVLANLESSQLLAECLFALGNAKLACGLAADAALNFIESLEIMADLDQIPKIVAHKGVVLATLAKAALAIDRTTMAAESLEKAIDCFEKVNAVVGTQNRQWLNLLQAYQDLTRLQMASKHYDLAQKNCEAAISLIATLTLAEQKSVENRLAEFQTLLLTCVSAEKRAA